MHADPIVPVLFTIVLVLVAGRLGSEIAARLRQPEVLGELVAGVALGNLGLLGFHRLEYLKTDSALELLAGLGVVLLLFEVGLESTVADMLKVGGSSLAVAALGVVAPMLLGWGVGAWLLPGRATEVHLFLGATLCATSVGITARVLQEIGRSRDKEARIILGAAVIDDVMGLVILAVVAGLVAAAAAGTALSLGSIATTTGIAAGFLFGAIAIGSLVTPRLVRLASYLRARGVLQATALGFCFLLAGLSGIIGLAPIVGAFAAGLLLEKVHFRHFAGGRGEEELEPAVHPLISWLAPFFFVQMGARVDLATFGRLEVQGLALALTIAAVIGKQVCGLGVLEPGLNRLAIGLGMIPRGEVGLIFAKIGHELTMGGERVIDDATFSAVVIMVVVTTMVTPGLLKWSFERRSAPAEVR
jgi:Kef-type K+ transport system membrane component KefB